MTYSSGPELLATLIGGETDDKRPCHLLIVELKDLETIADTLGETIAQRVLTMAQERVASMVPNATVGRVKDRLVLVGLSDGDNAADRVAELLNRAYLVMGHFIQVRALIGATSLAHSRPTSDVWKEATLALSYARNGAHSVRSFDRSMSIDAENQRKFEQELSRALPLRELWLAYQPQLNLQTRQISGFEALLRWRHPERGNVPPGEFIPVAERTGLITPIGEWVLKTACMTAAMWPSNVSVAVNVSAVQFAQDGLLEAVKSALKASGLDPRRLELEITESVFVRDQQSVLTSLTALKALGLSISLDDFGTGYSSLSYLRAFPFDKIKIDQAFIRGGADDGRGTIVRAIAALGAGLGMKTLAEGVETAQQLRSVFSAGCESVQGYLVGRPIPPELIAELLVSPDERQRLRDIFNDG